MDPPPVTRFARWAIDPAHFRECLRLGLSVSERSRCSTHVGREGLETAIGDGLVIETVEHERIYPQMVVWRFGSGAMRQVTRPLGDAASCRCASLQAHQMIAHQGTVSTRSLSQ